MAKRIEFNSKHHYFLLKAAACFAGLLIGGFIIAPPVSMQNSNTAIVVNNNSMRGMSNYQPTPEPQGNGDPRQASETTRDRTAEV